MMQAPMNMGMPSRPQNQPSQSSDQDLLNNFFSGMGNMGAAPPRPAVNQEQMIEMQIQAAAQRQAPILK